MNNREIILKCTEVNHKYMRLPAGKVSGLETMTAIYKRIAEQSLQCARAWVQDSPCPDHEPATDGFWWGVVAWSDAFGHSIGVDLDEWGKVFTCPHRGFAEYLLPGPHPEPLEPADGSPAEIIMELDARWTDRVIKLTAKWGFIHHFKDRKAMYEAQRLQDELRRPESPAYKAYLRSDLQFFRKLFRLFPFSIETYHRIHSFLYQAWIDG